MEIATKYSNSNDISSSLSSSEDEETEPKASPVIPNNNRSVETDLQSDAGSFRSHERPELSSSKDNSSIKPKRKARRPSVNKGGKPMGSRKPSKFQNLDNQKPRPSQKLKRHRRPRLSQKLKRRPKQRMSRKQKPRNELLV